MEINKAYNHKIITSINSQLQNVNNDNISSIYNDIKPISYIDISNNINDYFNVNIYSRKINVKNLLYETYYKHINYNEFINKFNSRNFNNKAINMSQYYPNEWISTMTYYELNFIPWNVLQYFENECDTLYEFTSIDTGSLSEKIKINITFNSKEYSQNNVNTIVDHVYNIIKWITDNYLENSKTLESVLLIQRESRGNKAITTINLMLSPFLKTFGNYDELNNYKYEWLNWINSTGSKEASCETNNININGISPYHINTGVSYHNNKINIITIFRIDEMFKVLIHELLHNLSLDVGEYEDFIGNDIQLIVGNSKILYNEAYVEYIAIIFWNYYVNHIFNKDLDKTKVFIKMINNEIVNSAINCKKLFDYYKIDNIHQIIKKNDLIQYTNGFSYIFIKYILLINLFSVKVSKRSVDTASNLKQLLIKEINQNICNYNYLTKLNINNIIDKHKMSLSIYRFKLN